MKITLNQANKHRNALEKLSLILPMSITLNSINDWSGTFNAHVKAVAQSIEADTKRMEFILELRREIAKANTVVGITDLMAVIAATELKIRTFAAAVASPRYGGAVKGIEDFEIAVHNFEQKAEKDPTFAVPVVKDTVSILADPKFQEMFDTLIKGLKKELDKKKEERNFLNYKTEIEISEGLEAFLKEQGIL